MGPVPAYLVLYLINFILYWPLRWCFHAMAKQEQVNYTPPYATVSSVTWGLFWSLFIFIIPVYLVCGFLVWLVGQIYDSKRFKNFMKTPLFKRDAGR